MHNFFMGYSFFLDLPLIEGVAVDVDCLCAVSRTLLGRGRDGVSRDPSHDGVDEGAVDEGDVANERIIDTYRNS